MNVKKLSLIAVVAASYAALVIFQPLSSDPIIQLRIADSLIPLCAFLGTPCAAGVALGALIGNWYYFLSPIDVILGPIANLLAGLIIYKFRDKLIFGCVSASVIIGVIVGGYLWFFAPPLLEVALPLWLVSILSTTFSSLITISVIGYSIVKALIAAGLPKLLGITNKSN